MNETIKSLAKALVESPCTVVFTGAGMSTESGLPDFRSSEGLWGKHRPEELASTEALNRNFENFVTFYRSRIDSMGEVKPNRGHEILARWEERGLVDAIVTQNVDGLHQEAGSKNVLELHGTLRKVRCQACGAEYPAGDYASRTDCAKCGGKLRPAVVLFGEMLPEDALSEAMSISSTCSLFIVLGSSLAVSPANLMPERAKRDGGALFIVNNTPTHLDAIANGVVRASIGDVLVAVDDLLADS